VSRTCLGCTVWVIWLCGLTGCTDFRVDHRTLDAAALQAAPLRYEFERAALADSPKVSEDARYMDQLMRSRLRAALATKGYLHSVEDPGVWIDFSVSELPVTAVPATATPRSIRDTWEGQDAVGRGAPDPMNSMDHRVASEGFSSRLQITVLLRSTESRRLIWEGSALQTLPEKRPRRFEAVVTKMVDQILSGLPMSD